MLEDILIGQAKADFEKKFIEFQRQRPDIKDRYFDETLLKWFYNAELFIQVAYIIGWLESVDIWIIEIECHIPKFRFYCRRSKKRLKRVNPFRSLEISFIFLVSNDLPQSGVKCFFSNKSS